MTLATMTDDGDQIESQQEKLDSQAATLEADYHLEEDDDEPKSDPLCCFDNRPEILTEELWTELKDLSVELIEYIKIKCWKKKILTAVLALSAIVVCGDMLFGTYISTQLAAFVEWMTAHPVDAVFAYIGIFIVATLCFIPPALLVFGAGFAFTASLVTIWQGVLAAMLVSWVGTLFSAIIAFFRARYMMRDLIQLFAKRYPLISCADRALEQDGLRVMFLLRLCPVIPFNGLNYCCGITDVSLMDFVISLIGIVPFQLFTIIVGSTAANYSTGKLHNNEDQELALIILLVSGGIFGLLAFFFIWRVVKKELQKELKISDAEMRDYLILKMDQSAGDVGVEVWEEDDGWFWVWA